MPKKHKWSLKDPAKFVSTWEGFRSEAYLDTLASPNVWTIAFGHTGPDVWPGKRVTRVQGLKLLARDLRWAAKVVKDSVHVPITIRQRMALISLAFNIGGGAFATSTLVRVLNEKRYKAAANEFLKWKFAGGVAIPGLLNRRRAERWMFTHPNA
jgi:lysozyme